MENIKKGRRVTGGVAQRRAKVRKKGCCWRERESLRTDSSLKLLPTRLLKRLDVKRVGGRLTWDVQLRKEVQSE